MDIQNLTRSPAQPPVDASQSPPPRAAREEAPPPPPAREAAQPNLGKEADYRA